jgi:hypothetical protein
MNLVSWTSASIKYCTWRFMLLIRVSVYGFYISISIDWFLNNLNWWEFSNIIIQKKIEFLNIFTNLHFILFFLILASFPHYNPINSSTSLSTTNNNKSTDSLRQTQSINTPTNNNYPSFFNIIPPINFSLPPPLSIPSNSTSHHKRSIPSIKKRPRLTAQLRNEILKLKATKPTVFVWEIQQNLLQNGICTAQTLPNVNF